MNFSVSPPALSYLSSEIPACELRTNTLLLSVPNVLNVADFLFFNLWSILGGYT